MGSAGGTTKYTKHTKERIFEQKATKRTKRDHGWGILLLRMVPQDPGFRLGFGF
jgi:hypothetical protein